MNPRLTERETSPASQPDRDEPRHSRGVSFVVLILLSLLGVAVMVIAAGAGVVAGYVGAKKWATQTQTTQVTGALGQVQNLGELVSLKVPATQIVQHTESVKLLEGSYAEMELRSAKVVLFAQGECLIASDLRNAASVDVDETKRTLTLVLPQPRVISSTVLHDRSEIYEMSSGRLEKLVANSDLQKKAVSRSFEIAQAQVRQYAQSPMVMQMARDNTEVVIRNLMQATGWQVTIRWK